MKAMVGLVIAILIVSVVTLFWPSDANDHLTEAVSKPAAAVETATNTADESLDPALAASEQKAARMQEEYEKLEQARMDLKRNLARLKHEMWGMTFPPDQAAEMNEIMLNAHKFEKTPRMLGAFLNVQEISAELDKVRFAIKSLEELEATINEAEKPAA